MQCPRCLSELSEKSKFCSECGAGVKQSQQISDQYRHIAEGERKNATVLFSDLSGYTAMTAKMDPEDVKILMGKIFEKAGRIVEKYQGTVERFFGDEVMILFGIPKIHEDDPARAIHTAVEIHQLVEDLSPAFEKEHQIPLSMHTGINSGLVITGDKYIGKGRHGLTGEAINLAKKLAGIAKTKEIIVGENTFQKAKHRFYFQEQEPVKLKGIKELVKIYKVEPEFKKLKKLERQIFSKIVGRDKELNQLACCVADVIKGKGCVVNVTGEAGIGKSRLLVEFSQSDIVKKVNLIEGKAISIGTSLPFYPVVDLLKNWAKIEEDDNERVALSKFESLVQSIDRDQADEIVPFAATLMGMKLSGKYKKRVEGITGESLEKLIFKNLRDLLIKASQRQTLIIVIEDLHWADESSIEILKILFHLTREYNILFINLFRPGFFNTGENILNSVQKDASFNSLEIVLKSLNMQSSELMVNNILDIRSLPDYVKHKIIDRTGGNPFFIEEVVRALIDEKAIVLQDNRFVLTEKSKEVKVPYTIADLLNARIDRLDDKTRELIKVASVIGRNFFHKILKQVANSVEDIDTRLDYLKNIQLIREIEHIEELEYLFKHALAQEVAYNSLLRTRRKKLHLDVANSIEALFKERLSEFYGTLSYHYINADAFDKAEEYMIKAGEEATKASASSEALRFYQKALDLYINKNGDKVDKAKIADLQENIGTSFLNKGLYSDAFYYFNKSRVNRGENKWKFGALNIFKLLVNLIVILRHLYLPAFGKKKIPSREQEYLLKHNLNIAKALITIDMMRCFYENMKNLRNTFQYDISKSQGSLNYVAGGITIFGITGVSFRLAGRFNQYVQKNLKGKNSQNSLLTYQMIKAILDFLVGSWQVTIDETSLEKAGERGELFSATSLLAWVGYMKIEMADFKACDYIINKLEQIGTEYNFFYAQDKVFALKSKLSMKIRETQNALSYIEEGLALSVKDGWEVREVEFLGIKAKSFMIDNDFEKAEKIFIKIKQIVNQIGETSIILYYISDYYTGLFNYNIQNFLKAVNENNSKNFFKFQKASIESGSAALKHAKKVASDRTEVFKLMGIYFWLTNNQKKALKWWDKSIKQGEQLGAKIELSRTFFEVGKNLQSSKSRFKHLNGFTAIEYLEKSKKMFGNMGLEWDLKELGKNV